MSFHPETESYKYWTQEEDLKLKDLVESNLYDFKDIGRQLNRSASSCQSHSRFLGFKSGYVRRKYFHTEDFFKTPNLLNCYWAGMLAADGSITHNSKLGSTLRLEIADIDHLYQFKKDVGFTGRIEDCFKNGSISNTKTVRINSCFWAKDLKDNFGIIPNKSYRLTPPNLNNDLLRFAFLLGYIDGDGCICLCKRKVDTELSLSLSIVSCSPSILLFLKDMVDRYFINYRLRKKKQVMGKCPGSNNASIIQFSGMQALMILDYFQGFPVPKLARKWQNPKVLEFLVQKKLEYPNFFKLTPELQVIKDQFMLTPPV